MGRAMELTPEQENEFRENIGLVIYCMRTHFKVTRTHPDYEDIYQHGCMALVRAVKGFDGRVEGRSSYYITAIKREISTRYYMPQYRLKRGGGKDITVSLDASPNCTRPRGEKPLTYAGLLAETGDMAESVVRKVSAEPLISYMRKKAPLTCMHLLDGKKWREIAKEMAISSAGLASARAALELKRVRKCIKKARSDRHRKRATGKQPQ